MDVLLFLNRIIVFHQLAKFFLILADNPSIAFNFRIFLLNHLSNDQNDEPFLLID